jgi:anti-sigma B factor antagonist
MKTIPTFDDDKALTLRGQVIPGSENGLILHLKGSLDLYGVPHFNRQISRIKEAGFTTIVCECSQLAYVSSTGVGSFIEVLKYARQNHGDVLFTAVQPAVYRVLELLGFTTFFIITDTLPRAIDCLGRQSPAYPKTFPCPVCSRRLLSKAAGRFRCPGCKVILNLNELGQVLLG